MRSALLGSVLLAGTLAACGGRANYVQADDVALGRVVVYRNGVAYYERRARVQGNQLRVTVPRARVDDFLKSLTAADAETGETLPVTFPSRQQAPGGMVEIVIQLPKNAKATDLKLTYVTESPAWKPSYRIEVNPKGGVLFQGLAIVDNTSGEDWKDVKVGVGSSSALSFRYDLWSVLSVQREQLSSKQRFALAPPTGSSPYQERFKQTQVLTALSDKDIPRAPGHPDYSKAPSSSSDEDAEPASLSRAPAARGGMGRGATRRSPSYDRRLRRIRKEAEQRRRRQQMAQQRVRVLANRLRNTRDTIYIDGYGAATDRNPRQKAGDLANTMRNRLIENGVPPARIKVRNHGFLAGHGAGVRVVLEKAPASKDRRVAKGSESDRPVGESHFESALPMTVERGSSVMVSIVKKPTAGEVVYLYDPESARGNKRYAFRSVRFRNPTPYTLESGPVTVFGKLRANDVGSGFVGEGLTDPIPPKAVAMVPFALDRQVIVDPLISKRDHIAKLMTLQRGILSAKIQHVRRTRLKLTSRLHRHTKVFIRHTGRAGWMLTKRPDKWEKLGRAYLFEVALGAGETKTIDIEEATPITKTLDLRSPVGLNMVKLFLSSSPDDPEFAAEIRKLVALQTALADTNVEIGNLRQRLRDYRVRMDELHAQIVSLKAVKTRGALMRHLQSKLKDISNRVQNATIKLVNLEEKAMTTRIRFEDALAELTLGKKPAMKKAPVAKK